MKKLFLLLIIFLSCSKSEKKMELVQFDSLAEYPEKEVLLESIADIFYVNFEEKGDEALFRGKPIHISSKTVSIFDFQSGDFYLFDRQGHLTARFNHKGSGPEDYMQVISAFVDENKNELYVIEKNKIKIYTKEGVFVRVLDLPKNAWVYEAADYDDHSILLVDNYERATAAYENLTQQNAETYQQPFVRISKTDGSVIEYIPVPKDFSVELTAPFQMGEMKMKVGGPLYRLVANKNGFLLYNQETDTLFLYQNDKSLNPVWVHYPAVKEMETKNYLNAYVEAGDYRFFEQVTLKIEKTPPPLSVSYLYDTKQNAFFRQKVVMNEFAGKVVSITPEMIQSSRDPHLGYLMLPLSELKDAFDKGLLSGKLKEIVSASSEEGNDILMLMHFT